MYELSTSDWTIVFSTPLPKVVSGAAVAKDAATRKSDNWILIGGGVVVLMLLFLK